MPRFALTTYSRSIFGLDSLCPTGLAKLATTMNLPNAIERLRGVLRRQHKALATERNARKQQARGRA